jgi:hypothetical protein
MQRDNQTLLAVMSEDRNQFQPTIDYPRAMIILAPR